MREWKTTSYPRSMTGSESRQLKKTKKQNRIDASSKVHCIVLKDRLKPKTSTGKAQARPEPHLENCTAKDKQISSNEELLTSLSCLKGFYRLSSDEDGLIRAIKIKQIRAQGGCPGTDCR